MYPYHDGVRIRQLHRLYELLLKYKCEITGCEELDGAYFIGVSGIASRPSGEFIVLAPIEEEDDAHNSKVTVSNVFEPK